jgi:hypothetical protein
MVADRTGNRVGSYRITGSGAGTTLTAVTDSILTVGTTVVKAAHISELRAAFIAIE